jgi:hypothetical protein
MQARPVFCAQHGATACRKNALISNGQFIDRCRFHVAKAFFTFAFKE